MKNIVACISILFVFITFSDFFRNGDCNLFEQIADIENTEAFEDSSSVDEEDDKELIHQESIYNLSSSVFATVFFIPHSHFSDLHSPPPEVSALI